MATSKALLFAPSVKLIGIGWCGFIAENLILSENRTKIIATIGDENYHRIYNTLSTSACAAIAYGYWIGRNKGPQFRIPGKYSRVGAFGLQAVGLGMAAQFVPKLQVPVEINLFSSTPNDLDSTVESPTVSAPQLSTTEATVANKKEDTVMSIRCPMDFTPADIPADGVYGVKRITRHAMFWSFGMVSLGIALRARYMSSAVMFTMPAVFALVGGSHQDSRYRRGMGGSLEKEIDDVTSTVPFVALLSGHQSWSALVSELKATNTVLALAVAGFFAL